MKHEIETDIRCATNRLKCLIREGTYLVTGATGMIGRYLVRMLAQFHNVKVIAACRSREKAEQIFSAYPRSENIVVVVFDICTSDWPIEGSVDYIIHAAGVCDNKFCENHPNEVIRVNALGVYEALKFAERKSSKKIIVFSSASVYGKLMDERLSESVTGYVDFTNIHNSYAISKRVAESICQSYMLHNPMCIVRPFHIISPELIKSPNSMIGEFYERLNQGKPIAIHGDGLSKRNFTYIVDVCEMVLFLSAVGEGTYNIGNEKGDRSVLQILQIEESVLKKFGYIKHNKSSLEFGCLTGKSSNVNNMIPNIQALQNMCRKYNYLMEMCSPELAFEKCIPSISFAN